MLFKSALLVAGGLAGLTAAVPSLETKNNIFVNPSTGKRFQVVGVAYQPGGSSGYDPELGIDPLSDAEVCKRDAALMQILGVNAIRSYNLNPDINHDECASIFNAAGIYMLLDVNSPLAGESLDRSAPANSYHAAYLNRTFAVVEAFKNYPNTLAFFSANEVINDVATAELTPPYIRAVTRDIKNYVAKNVDREIPVGYSAADVRDVLWDTWNYFQCYLDGDSSDMSHADLFALNSYSWCGESDYLTAGYDQLVAGFEGSTVPVFFSEYGCNDPQPRLFDEPSSIYSSNMTDVFSGGIVYEYTQEDNNYGLVQIHDNGSVTLMDDYLTLKDQLALLDWDSIQDSDYDESILVTDLTECDSDLITEAGFNSSFTIPEAGDDIQSIIDDGVSPAPTGQIVTIDDYSFSYTIMYPNGTEMTGVQVKALGDDEINSSGSNDADGSSSSSDDEDAAAGLVAPVMGVALAAAAGMLVLL